MSHPLHCSKDQFVEKSNPLAMYTVNIKKKEQHGSHPYLKLYIFFHLLECSLSSPLDS